MPGLVTNKKSIQEGGTSSLLGEHVSRLLQGLIPLSCYIFSLYFSFFPVCFLVEDFLRREECKELVFQYMFSLQVFYLRQFWWILLGYIKARFWPVLAATRFGHVWVRKDYIGISLVVFCLQFSRHNSFLLVVIFLYHSGLVSCISAC